MTNSNKALDLEPIQARCEAATPGPWGYHHEVNEVYSEQCDDESSFQMAWFAYGTVYRRMKRREHDGNFIAHAREDIPALIAEVERLRDGLRRYDRELSKALEQVKALTNERNSALVKCKTMQGLLGDVAQLHARESYETPSGKGEVVLRHGDINVLWVRDQARALVDLLPLSK